MILFPGVSIFSSPLHKKRNSASLRFVPPTEWKNSPSQTEWFEHPSASRQRRGRSSVADPSRGSVSCPRTRLEGFLHCVGVPSPERGPLLAFAMCPEHSCYRRKEEKYYVSLGTAAGKWGQVLAMLNWTSNRRFALYSVLPRTSRNRGSSNSVGDIDVWKLHSQAQRIHVRHRAHVSSS